MKNVYLASDSMITSLGMNTGDNMRMLYAGNTGISLLEDKKIASAPVPASRVDWGKVNTPFEGHPKKHTQLEKLILLTVKDALLHTSISPEDPRTVLVFSTTKGNIDLLENDDFPQKRLYLHAMASFISSELDSPNKPIVVSNACISGVLAINTAQQLLEQGKYDHAIVIGVDLITGFVLSGFQAFKAISERPCKPYDESRDGITLGEGCGVMVLTTDPVLSMGVRVISGATSNDANHISGPSRTGDGLHLTIKKTLEYAKIDGFDTVDCISSHGTATPYNDEMESRAFALAGLSEVPLHSLKGFWGHTLGAAGVIESIAAIHALKSQMLLGTCGYETQGVSQPLNVTPNTYKSTLPLQTCLKTASGFGGCNAAVLFALS
ncbi:beta-ketoacyl synthase [bacterium]|nr:beta-ketoacyl synthase [bacterium]